MNISSYPEFIGAVNRQPNPQRLLFVFVESQLPSSPTENQKQDFHAQQGGTLSPVMCVDKLPCEMTRFEALVDESSRIAQHWDIVFAAALSSRDTTVPTSDDAEQPLRNMID
ncbi:MAG: ribonucleotide reductase subunit alpha, partial [Herminiimonas sp.]|nr:ribonucleotide reductase subunit alpha [Herminiimonas sp.]